MKTQLTIKGAPLPGQPGNLQILNITERVKPVSLNEIQVRGIKSVC
jgi:hypothetical protein